MTADPLYVAARRVLLDALEDLHDHRDAIIIVGAQAVYLRTGDANVGVAEYTTDGDLAINSDRLASRPLLEEAMGRRFEHKPGSGSAIEPGIWIQTVDVVGEQVEIPVDLIVPSGIAPAAGTRGARLGEHGKRAARKAPGIEVAIVDNDHLVVGALDPGDTRRLEVRVARPTAMLVAKAHKIGDRLARADRPDRLIDKDAADVYRLMQTTPASVVNAVLDGLGDDQRIAGPATRGMELLRHQFGTQRAPGRRDGRASASARRPRGAHQGRLHRLRRSPRVGRVRGSVSDVGRGSRGAVR
jgi:hypothetical protein